MPTPLEAEAERLAASAAFARSARLRTLLRWLVEQAERGEGDRVNAYRVGVETLGREPDFDPSTSSIVRMEMARLRRALDAAYADGSAGSHRIEIPRGSYRPRLAAQAASPALRLPIATGPTLVLVPCVALGGLEDVQAGLHHELLWAFSRFDDFRVVDGSGLGERSRREQLQAAVELFDGHYLVSGALRGPEDRLGAVLDVIDTQDGRVVWTGRFQGDPDPRRLIAFLDEVAGAAARRLLSAAGVLRSAEFERWHVPTASWAAWDCVNRWHFYRVDARDPALSEQLRRRIDAELEEQPGWAQGWLMRGFLALDGLIHRMEAEVDAAALDALLEDCIGRARSVLPESSQATYLEALRARFLGEASAFGPLLRRAIEQNPHRVETLHHGGTLLAFQGDWAAGSELVDAAELRYHSSFAYRFFGVVEALRDEETERAGALLASAAASTRSYWQDLLEALVARRLGDARRAEAALAAAFDRAPGLEGELALELRRWFGSSPLGERLLTELGDVRRAAPP